MTRKKQPKKSPRSQDPVFIGIDGEDILFTKPTLESAQGKAQELIESGSYDSVTILCVVGAWVAEMPPEEVKLSELDLNDLAIEEE